MNRIYEKTRRRGYYLRHWISLLMQYFVLLSEIANKPRTVYKGCIDGHQHTVQWIQTLNSKAMQIVLLYNIDLPSN